MKRVIPFIFISSFIFCQAAHSQCVGTQGQVTWQYWEDIPFYNIAYFFVDDTYPSGPDKVRVLNSLTTPMNFDEHYASITKGFISVPDTGPVTFNLTGDDQAYFLLSSDTTASNLDTVAWLDQATGREEHNAAPNQTSVAINLIADQLYYFELYMVEFGGGDHASVYWQRPYVSDSTWQLISSPFLTDTCDPICPPKGTACDDGDSATSNDVQDGSCNCVGSAVPQGFSTGDRGLLQAYFFDDIVGGDLTTLFDDPDFPTMPDRMVNHVAGLSARWQDDIDDFGTHIQGYLTVPVTGCYDFNITGVNQVRFSLSADHQPANITDSIFTFWGTGILEHDHPSFNGAQTMSDICLEANTYYYFEFVQAVPSWGYYFNVFWNGPQHSDTAWHKIPEIFVYDYADELACLPLGSPCDDGDPLTANDQINASCDCAGTPCTPLVDCDDPAANFVKYDYCETTYELDTRADDAWLSCTPIANPYVTERSGMHWIHYDLGTVYLLGRTHIWNYNVAGETDKGFQSVAVDYSVDGASWFHLDDFTWTLASGSTGYTGFDGPDFQGMEARYVMFTSLDSPTTCRGISKITFEAEGCGPAGSPCDDGLADTFNDHIDDNCICRGYTISELDCGIDTLYINQSELTPNTYHAISALMSQGSILDGGDVHYKAGMEIVMEAGFEVSEGGILEAEIEDCPSSIWNGPSGKKVYAIVDNTAPKKIQETARPETALKVYPLTGHTQQTIHLQLEKAGRVKIEILDQNGLVLHIITNHHYSNFGDHYKRVQTKKLESGVYMIRMTLGDSTQYLEKMVVG